MVKNTIYYRNCTFKWSQMYDTLLILIFCKNVLCHIGRTGGRCAIFVECTANYCDELLFWGIRIGQLYCFS